MKRLLVVSMFFVALIGLAAPSAHAVGVYGIWWMPDNSDDDGWGAGIKDTRQFTPLLSLDGRVSYVSFSTPDAGIIPLEATALVHLAMWYGGIGVGYYFFTGDAAIEDSFGWYLMLGLEIALGGTGVFGEVKWQALEPDLDIPSGGSADFESVAIHVGASFGIPLK
jgi:hypothetical protein